MTKSIQSVSYLLLTLHASHQTTNYPKNHEISPDTSHIKQKLNKHQTQNFQRISPFSICPFKNAHKARTCWYCGWTIPSIYQNQIFFLKYKKGMDRSNKKNSKILYECITANTSVIWQHAAHTIDQLSSPNC